jgi:hypothetical protein
MYRKFLFLSMVLEGMIATTAGGASAQVHSLPYEGRITTASGARLPKDTATVSFSIFRDFTFGFPLWGPETHPAVLMQNGVFNVQLGSRLPFPPGLFDGSTMYLEIKVRDQILEPRQPISSVPYALHALDGAGIAYRFNQ